VYYLYQSGYYSYLISAQCGLGLFGWEVLTAHLFVLIKSCWVARVYGKLFYESNNNYIKNFQIMNYYKKIPKHTFSHASIQVQKYSSWIICYLRANYVCLVKIYFLQPEKIHLGFFALRALQFWEMALFFLLFLGKFCFNIFLNLKSKQIKYLPTFLLFWTKQSLCKLFKILISQRLYHELDSNKFSVIMIRLF